MKEKQLVKYYETEAQRELKSVQIAQKDLQRICDEFAKVTKGKKPLDISELKTMFAPSYGAPKADTETIKDLVFDRFAPSKMFAGLRIKRDAVELPPTDAIVAAIQNTIKEATGYLAAGYFEIVGGVVQVKDWVEQTVVEEHKVYAETDEELLRFALAKELADTLNKIQEILPPEPVFKSKLYFLDGNLDTVVESDDEGVYHPSPYFIKYGRAVRTGSFTVTPEPKPKETAPANADFDKYLDTLMNG